MHNACILLLCALTIATSPETMADHLQDTLTMDHVPEFQPTVVRWRDYVHRVEMSIDSSKDQPYVRLCITIM